MVSYNILAEHHRRKTADGYLKHTEAQYLDLSYRHKRIIQEIQALNADVVCMQEVDSNYFSETLNDAMSR